MSLRSRSPVRRLALGPALVLLSGCIASYRVPYRAESARWRPTAPSTLDVAVRQPERVEYTNHLEPRLATRSHRLRRIEFASTGDNGQPGKRLSALYYESRTPGTKPLVLVLPIWGSSTYPSRKITQGITRRRPDTNVFRLLGAERLLDWNGMASLAHEREVLPAIEGTVERMGVAVSDVSRIIDWAHGRPEIDRDRIAIVGFSVGAVITSVALANEPRIGAGVVVMGAAELHDVVTTCPGDRARAREHIVSRFGWTLEGYREAFRTALASLDASYQSPRLDPRRILMIDAHYDECMPAHAREELWRRLGRPKRISYRYGHKRAFLSMTPLGLNRMRHHIYKFLDQALHPGDVTAPPLRAGAERP